MDRKGHDIIGAFAGGISYLGDIKEHNETFNLAEFLLNICSGVIGSRLPDLIEPATSPSHRKFFHSLTCLTAISIADEKVNNYFIRTNRLSSRQRRLFKSVSRGYTSHLVGDSTTHNGLPII